MTADDRPVFDPCEALPVKAAAALLHVSEPTIRGLIRREELPSVVIGRCRRVRRADLERFLDDRTALGWQSRSRKRADDAYLEAPPLEGAF